MASQKYNILYGRLSQEDERQGESNSIHNQKLFLEKYAADNGFENTLFLADDGYSGTNFDRPAWKKIVEMIEGGERNSARVAQAVTETIEEEPLARIDYVEVVNLGNMQPVETLPERGLVAIAVYIGSTRLIDNYLYDFE